MSRPAHRVFVVGIDGGTLDLIEPWAEAGKLPSFRRMMSEGVTGPLESTIHPLTPQAWASFLSGMNPGKHGIFDFGERREGSYEISLATSLSRKGAAIWDHLRAGGRTCGIVNVPLTYPPTPVPGFMVAGMHTEDPSRAFEPASLYHDVRLKYPGYRIDVMSYWYQGYDPFLEDLEAMHCVREALVLDLYAQHRPDLMAAVFVSTDRVSHALWGQSELPGEKVSRAGWKYAHELERVYRRVDATLGKVLDAAGDSVVIAMSDHGFGTLEKDVYLNKFLVDAGYLSFRKGPGWFQRWRGAAAPAGPPARSMATVDWSRTVAYSHGLFGNIWLNLKGREPEGIVARGVPEDDLKSEISEALMRLVDPEDGKPIVDRVYRKEELYRGECFERAPDLLVRMRNYAYMTRGAAEFSWTDSLVSRPLLNHTGNHRMEGIFIARGGPFRKGARIEGAHIMDLAPTILHLMGLGVSTEMDGKVLSGGYEPGYLDASPVELVTPRGKPARPVADVTPGEMEQIRKNLERLGYLE